MNRVKLFIIAGIVGVIIIIFIIIFLLGESRPPTPTTTIPNVNPTITAPVFDTTQLYITSITPLNTNSSYLPVQPVQINFTQSVSKTGFKYAVTPITDTIVTAEENQRSIIIAPKTIWSDGITTITIESTTISSTGNVLKNPQVYRLNTAIPTIPDLQGAY